MYKRQVLFQKISIPGSISKKWGLSDLSILTKYGIYRRNTWRYTFGIPATLGLEFPTGTNSFTSETWDIEPGVYISWRRGPWASDFNIVYIWNGFADKGIGGTDPGDELSLDWAFAYQFSIRNKAHISLTPVVELSYKSIFPDKFKGHNMLNTGESVLYLSPGIKFTMSSFIFETLLQVPVMQIQKGAQLRQDTNVLVGIRLMF